MGRGAEGIGRIGPAGPIARRARVWDIAWPRGSGESAGDGGGDEGGDGAGDHGTDAEFCDIGASVWSHASDASDLDGDGSEVCETAEGVGGDEDAP